MRVFGSECRRVCGCCYVDHGSSKITTNGPDPSSDMLRGKKLQGEWKVNQGQTVASCKEEGKKEQKKSNLLQDVTP